VNQDSEEYKEHPGSIDYQVWKDQKVNLAYPESKEAQAQSEKLVNLEPSVKIGLPLIPRRDGQDGLSGIARLKGEPGTPYTEENVQRSRGKSTHLNSSLNHKKNMDIDDTLMQNESSDGNQTDTMLPASIEPFGEEAKHSAVLNPSLHMLTKIIQ
jgi:hypothetical protein